MQAVDRGLTHRVPLQRAMTRWRWMCLEQQQQQQLLLLPLLLLGRGHLPQGSWVLVGAQLRQAQQPRHMQAQTQLWQTPRLVKPLPEQQLRKETRLLQ